eukprot:9149243-Prorocentrum_lima.AAC.1
MKKKAVSMEAVPSDLRSSDLPDLATIMESFERQIELPDRQLLNEMMTEFAPRAEAAEDADEA